MNHNQSSAKKADRAVLELATILSDSKWHRTTYLGLAAGKYMRPEIAWRTGHGSIEQGQRRSVNIKLNVWERMGRVEKRRNGKFVEWRLAETEWVIPYLRALIEIMREQMDRSSPSPRKGGRLERAERKREIMRLHKEGFSLRQIGGKVGCHHKTVWQYLKGGG